MRRFAPLSATFALLLALAPSGLRAESAAAPPPFEISNLEVAPDRDSPQACLVFSTKLARPQAVTYGDFVKVEPAIQAVVSVRDDRLCVEGFSFGETYTLTARKGLPDADGRQLADNGEYTIDVPNRPPSMAFQGNGYVLPKTGGEGLPLRSVNVDSAHVRILRINDRGLIDKIDRASGNNLLSQYGVDDIKDQSGEKIWEGELAIQSKLNAPVLTALPIDQTIGALKPGLYAAVAATRKDQEEPWMDMATQWFVVSDIGLTGWSGQDGLTVDVRSLSDVKPMGAIALKLLARNNAILGEATSDANGTAKFDAGLLKGEGGNAPKAVYAYGAGGEFSFIDLSRAGFDLSDRGVGGREAPGALDAYLYPERGIYRPGETVRLTAVLRDAAAKAATGLPLVVKITRPDGSEVDRKTLADLGGGSYSLAYDLADTAYSGMWTATAQTDEKGPVLGQVSFKVEDFVPPRLELKLTGTGSISAAAPIELALKADYLYGAPGSGLNGERMLLVRRAEAPFEAYKDYSFGLIQEDFLPVQQATEPLTTDDSGSVALPVQLDEAPDSTHPLEAVVTATVFDIDGRPARKRLTLPVARDKAVIGIKPRFDTDSAPAGQDVGFDVVALGPDDKPVDLAGLKYDVIAEDVNYVWYRANEQWGWQESITERRIGGGTVDLTAAAPVAVTARTEDWGRYRIEIYQPDGAVATSVRYAVGWRGDPTAEEKPDTVSVKLDKDRYAAGETAQVFIKPPFDAEVLLAVADSGVRSVQSISVPKDGTTIQLPITADWAPGSYVLATAYGKPGSRPGSSVAQRAIGLAWFGLDTADRTLAVSIESPEQTTPGQTLAIPVSIANVKPGDTVRLTLAAVDDGVLQLTGYNSPDPGSHFLGKRRLGLEIRDLYGKLIDVGGAQRGTIRQGGDGSLDRQVSGLPDRSSKVVSLYSGIVTVGADGKASVPFDLPDFNGRVRVMAAAWSESGFGHADKMMIIRAPVIADLALPRFLAPGDTASLRVNLRNLDGPEGAYTASVSGDGVIGVEGGRFDLGMLAKGQQGGGVLTVKGAMLGTGKLALAVTGPDGFSLTRDYQLSVRPAQTVTTSRMMSRLDPGGSFTLSRDLAAGMLPGSAEISMAVASVPDVNVPQLIKTLNRYPYGCAEQTTSSALPLLVMNDVAKSLGLETDETIRTRVQFAVSKLVSYQNGDGSFGLWGPFESGGLWLTSYVTDFLVRARDAGYTVPQAPIRNALKWMGSQVATSNFEDNRLVDLAYAHYVLAKAQAIDISEIRYMYASFWSKLPSDLSRAQLGAALAALGDAERARQAFGKLTGERIWLAGMYDYGSPLRDTAAVLTLKAESGVFQPAELLQDAEKLGKGFTSRSYWSTQEMSWTLLATNAILRQGAEMTLSVDGKDEPTRTAPLYVSLDGGVAAKRIENKGGNQLYQVVTVSGIPADPLPPAAGGFGITRQILKSDGQPADLAHVKQNDQLVVLIKGTVSDVTETANPLVVDLLPAGFEPEDIKLLNATSATGYEWIGPLTSVPRVEYRDDRFVAALPLTSSDSTTKDFTLAYVVRAVTPGKFILPAPYVEDMYRPQLFARGSTGSVTVEAPGK